MSRLINTRDLHNVVTKRKMEYGKLATLVGNIIEEMVKETPTTISIPDNATNGDMLTALFGEKALITLDTHNYLKDWWNAPYREVKE